MPVFLSPGVFTTEVDLTALPASVGAVNPAFFGTAKKGPLNTPTVITSAQQYVDVFGDPFPESYLGYAVLAYLEEGNQCVVTRIGVECEPGQADELADICIDTSGSNVEGWGRIPLFSGIDLGRINLRAVSEDDPYTFHASSVTTPEYNDAEFSTTHGATVASMSVTGTYNGAVEEQYTLLITGAPTVSSNEKLGGATFEVIQNSDGTILASGVLTEEGAGGVSQAIGLANGLTLVITVTSGVLGVNDTFTFTATPDNRRFQFSVEGTNGSTYTMPSTTYTTAAAFVAAFNALLSGEDYQAVEVTLSDGTVIPQIQTLNAGRWIQLVATAGWALEVGQSQYAYDIPRGYLIGTIEGPYNISAINNQVVINIIGAASTVQASFTVAAGVGVTVEQLAATINPSGVVSGQRAFSCIALTVPGGDTFICFITDLNNQEFSMIQMLANFSHLKTLRFAEEVGILFPYQRNYRGFTDSRVSLPTPGHLDEATPLSCEDDPSSTECTADTAYFQNIVGFLVAVSPGTWIDNYTATLELFTAGVGDPAGRYQITIRDLNNVVQDVVQDVSFDKNSTRYIGNVVNPGSSLGGRNGNAFYNWEPRPAFLSYDPTLSSYDVRLPSTFARMPFEGGANGIPTDPAFSSELDAAIIGNPATGTGIYGVQNPDVWDINLLLTPGFSSGAVIAQCLQLCEGRGDVLYLVDPPFGLRPQQVVDWHNGMLVSDLSSAINSSYGALQWSWLKIFDQFTQQEIWVPPSGHVSALFARTSRVAQLWNAPAGLQRGRILTALAIEFNPTRGDMDLMYGNGNAVNPIISLPQDGIVLFGQRTLQRQASALDRISVRMLLITIKKSLTRLLRNFLFEPNDETLWSQIANAINPYLANIQGQRGLTGYKVVVDASNNTPERRDRNEVWVTVFVQPTKAAEFAALNIVVLRTNASFSSSEALAAGGIIAG